MQNNKNSIIYGLNNVKFNNKYKKNNYFSQIMEKDYAYLESIGAEKILIGKTYLNKPIFAFKVGRGKPVILAQFAIHAREYITYFLAIKYIKKLLKNKNLLGTVYFIPVVNVDGVSLAFSGKKCAKNTKFYGFLSKFGENYDFSQWKANIRGVDLNTNFPARWGSGKFNKLTADAQNYIGTSPASELETKYLMQFTKIIKPDITLSFHSKGEVIFYDFHQNLKNRIRDYRIARVVSRATGYKIKRTGKSAGGYKDWCIESLKIPALTIEVGADSLSHPIKRENLAKIWAKTSNLIDDLLYFLNKFYYN